MLYRNRSFRLFGLLLATGVLVSAISPGITQAHQEHQQHQSASEPPGSRHMASMTNFKRTVPADYRIMNRTPVIDDQASLLGGRSLYMRRCASCHGSLGRGDGPAAAGMKTAPADFLDQEHSSHYGPGDKYWIIAKGDWELGMPAHPELAPLEIWHLVNYLLALQAKVKSEGYDRSPQKHGSH